MSKQRKIEEQEARRCLEGVEAEAGHIRVLTLRLADGAALKVDDVLPAELIL